VWAVSHAATLLASSPLSANAYIGSGLAILFLILFAETGLLVGFFLPGDTLLLLAGYHTVAKHPSPHFGYWETVLVCIAGAVVGAQTGHLIGRLAGERLFDTPARRERVARTHDILHRFGEGKAVVLARFIPLVRTFMNPAVGVTGMGARDFAVWNVVGAVLWCPVVLALGRALPKDFPIDAIILGIVVVSLSLPVVEAVRRRRRQPSAD
jgi:membrane-associated protein